MILLFSNKELRCSRTFGFVLVSENPECQYEQNYDEKLGEIGEDVGERDRIT